MIKVYKIIWLYSDIEKKKRKLLFVLNLGPGLNFQVYISCRVMIFLAFFSNLCSGKDASFNEYKL